MEADLEGEMEVQETNQKHTTKERPKRRGRKASANETEDASEKLEKAEDHLKAINTDGKLAVVLPTTSNEIDNTNTEIVADLEIKPKRRARKSICKGNEHDVGQKGEDCRYFSTSQRSGTFAVHQKEFGSLGIKGATRACTGCYFEYIQGRTRSR